MRRLAVGWRCGGLVWSGVKRSGGAAAVRGKWSTGGFRRLSEMSVRTKQYSCRYSWKPVFSRLLPQTRASRVGAELAERSGRAPVPPEAYAQRRVTHESALPSLADLQLDATELD